MPVAIPCLDQKCPDAEDLGQRANAVNTVCIHSIDTARRGLNRRRGVVVFKEEGRIERIGAAFCYGEEGGAKGGRVGGCRAVRAFAGGNSVIKFCFQVIEC